MGKTGTTNEFRDVLFVGSTYGNEGITVAVRIGFDDNRSLGPRETGGRVALPVFEELMLKVYREKLIGPAPAFPARMEQNINDYSAGGAAAPDEFSSALHPTKPSPPHPLRFGNGRKLISDNLQFARLRGAQKSLNNRPILDCNIFRHRLRFTPSKESRSMTGG